MVSVVGDADSTRALIRSRGLTPGKIQTGSVSRDSSGKRTTRSASGEFIRNEETVYVDQDDNIVSRGTPDAEKKVLTTIKGEAPNLAGGTQKDQQVFYDAQGHQLSPYESYVVESRGGGACTEEGDVFYTYQAPPPAQKRLFKEGFYRDYPYLAALKEAEVHEMIWSPGVAAIRNAVNKEVFKLKTTEALKERLATASTEESFQEALKGYKSFTKYNLLTDRESYGDIESNNPLSKLVGAFSLGAKTIGGATEALLFEQEAKIRYKDRQAIGTDETGVYALNVLKDSTRDAAATGLKISRNLIGGAVTDLGNSPVQAAIFAASFGLGGVVGAAKGAGITGKVAAVAETSVYTRSFVTGAGLGLKTVGYGALGYAGYKAATSGDAVAGLSRLGGQMLSFRGAFKFGEAAGFGMGVSASNTASAISSNIASLEIRSLKGLGKKGAVFRGGRRVSPQSKVTISQQNKGITPKQQKGVRISQDKGETILKTRNKGARQFYEQQLQQSGVKVKEVRIKGKPAQYKLTESGQRVLSKQPQNVRVEVVLRRGDYFRVEYVNKPGFRKPVKVTKPIYQTTTGTSASKSGDQIILTRTTRQIKDLHFPSKTVQKKVMLNDQKQLLIKGDPARSVYSAQNIRTDPLKVDLGQTPSSTTRTGGGFRPGIDRASIVDPNKITYIKSGLRELRGAQLPSGNVPRTQFEVATTIDKSSNLIIGVPIVYDKNKYDQSVITAQPVAIKSYQGTQSSFFTDNSFKTDTAQATATDSLFDQATTPDTRRGSASSSRGETPFKPSPEPPPSDPIITPKTAPPDNIFTPRPPRPPPPEKPILLFPPIFSRNKERETSAPGFNVEARFGGIFKTISRSPLSLKEAVSFGSSVVGSSSQASFRVSSSSQPASGRFFGRSQIQDFEARPGGLFVEKREKRINTIGELIGITRKGQLAQRNKRSVFKL